MKADKSPDFGEMSRSDRENFNSSNGKTSFINHSSVSLPYAAIFS